MYRVPMPGLLELACAVVICSADWFLLSRVLHWFMHLNPAIDTAIEHDSRLSLISKKKFTSLSSLRLQMLYLAVRAILVQSSLGKCSDLFQTLPDPC